MKHGRCWKNVRMLVVCGVAGAGATVLVARPSFAAKKPRPAAPLNALSKADDQAIRRIVLPKGQVRLNYVLTKGSDGWKIAHAANIRIDAEAVKHDPVNSPRK